MKKKRMFMLLMLLCQLTMISAQNQIDQMVEKFSATGDCTFTSAVERDPKTRRIVKVVKVLELGNTSVSRFKAAFEAERNTGTYRVKTEGDEVTIVLSTNNSKTNRIYMLKYEKEGKYFSEAKITIIIKFVNP